MLIYNANGPSGYRIANSLRFRSSASAYLNRTPASAGNRQTWTWSGWVKRGALGSTQEVFGVRAGNDNDALQLRFNSTDALALYGSWNGSSYDFQTVTNQVFRDPSAWYHIVCVYNSTNATSTNRLAVYINGVQVTSFSAVTYPSQNFNSYINTTNPHTIAAYNGAYYFDGYMADINFIDGQALTPSSFGQTNPVTGVWQPKAYSGTYGTNGFKLNFNNTTSTTTLGYDTSGNSNNWTTNNLSLTTGATYDSMLDSPTNYDNGGNGVGNYCVISPLSGTSGSAVTNGNLTVTGSSSSGDSRYGSFGVSSGKWYWEHTVTNVGTGGVLAGISSDNNQTSALTGVFGYYINGNKYNGATPSAYGASFTTGDVIGVAFDADAGTLTFYKNNTSQGVAFTGITGTYYPLSRGSNSGTATVSDHNFGQRSFAYTTPSGYKSLCTFNLPTPTIQNGANYMAATTYTGTGSSLSVSNTVNSVSFQPDFVWCKGRSLAYDNGLYDSVRGVNQMLVSNTTGQEYTIASSVTAFNTNGFSLGSNITFNQSGGTFIGWQWKAGGTAVTNTAGSITSQVSANTTAGFSVVTFTAQSSGTSTIGHGLGVAPSMMILKARNATLGWPTYHSSIGFSGYLNLNTTSSISTSSNAFTSTSSTTFGLGTDFAVGYNYVAYCFAAIAGYSAFGSFSGNASTDGVFVYTGFLPRLVMVKCSSGTGNWFMLDSSRNTYNVVNNQLYPNLSNAESATTTLDILSNGFKMRTSSDPNASATYVYAAWASNPFQNSLAN